MDYLNIYREMISFRGLTAHTLKSYSTYISAYLDYLKAINLKPEEVSYAHMRDFIRWIQKERGLCDRTINVIIAQLRFFTIYVLHKEWDSTQIPARRFDKYLPFVPSMEEVWIFITSITDLKFKALIVLLYSCGLRSSEARMLKYEDVDGKNMRIHIRKAKSRKDRYVPLSKDALSVLTEYWQKCGKPRDWLFPSSHKKKGVPVSSQYLSFYIREQEKHLGWPPRITAHTFRHAYATHHYENGTDLLTIKALLGHSSLNSTVIYVELADKKLHDAPNPFDVLGKRYGKEK